MCSAKSDAKVAPELQTEMRAYKEGMALSEPRFMDFIDEFDSPWSVTMATIWPNLIVQREMNTLGIRQIVPTGPHEFIMKWTMFGFEGDDDAMTRHRLRQGNLMGPAGFLGLETTRRSSSCRTACSTCRMGGISSSSIRQTRPAPQIR